MPKTYLPSTLTRSFKGCITVLVVLVAIAFFAFRIASPFLRNRSDGSHSERNRRPPILNQPTPADIETATRNNLRLGNPSGATPDPNNPTNYLLLNQAYALSYNRDRGTPNWVSWRLAPGDIGDIQRQDNYRPDDRLPDGWPQILPTDYIRSGYTRGHLCPAGDRTSTAAANDLTFLMTNMVPQTDDSNQGVWETLEVYCRQLARHDATLYIVAGAYGDKSRWHNRLTIPTNIWKVVVVVPAGEELGDGLSPSTRVIAIDTPNIGGVRYDDWRKYTTTVRAIEKATGLDLLSAFPRADQDRVETTVGNF